jgi:hypothetical protein
MRRDSGGGGRGGAGGARGAGARRGGQGRRGQQPRRPAQPGKSRRRGGCGTRSSIPASRRRFTTARPRWSSVSLDLPSGGCSGQRACLHASLCLGVPLATGTHNNSTLSLSLSLSLSHTQTRRSRVQAAEAAAEAAGRADLLRTRTVLTPPSVLAAAGVPVFRCVQPRASFVVLWPGAHAAGFSTGFNIAETTTLAPPDWLPYAPLWPLPTDSGAPEDNRRTHTAPSPAPPFAREDVLGWRACPHAQPSTPAVGCP